MVNQQKDRMGINTENRERNEQEGSSTMNNENSMK